MKKNIILCTLTLVSTCAYSSTDFDAAQNKVFYDILIAKPNNTQITTRVHDLKQLAALMVWQMWQQLASPWAQKSFIMIMPKEKKGLGNLNAFASHLCNAQQGPSTIVNRAFSYARAPLLQITPQSIANLSQKQAAKFYLDNFNQMYTPIIDAIEKTNNKKTNFPHAITMDTLSVWASENPEKAFANEPDL